MATMTAVTTTDAILVVHSSKSRLRVNRVAEFLAALEEAYNALLLFDSLLGDYNRVASF